MTSELSPARRRLPGGNRPGHRAGLPGPDLGLARATGRVLAWRSEAPEGAGDWYQREAAWILSWRRPGGLTPYRVLGCAAVLSPRVQWERLREELPGMIWSGRAPELGLGRSRETCQRILDGGPLRGPGWGPKVRAFFRALAGDRQAVPVDVWSARVALGTKPGGGDWPMTPARRRLVVQAHRAASLVLGEPPREVQVAAWVAIRGGAS